jgi:hypothetical protein
VKDGYEVVRANTKEAKCMTASIGISVSSCSSGHQLGANLLTETTTSCETAKTIYLERNILETIHEVKSAP